MEEGSKADRPAIIAVPDGHLGEFVEEMFRRADIPYPDVEEDLDTGYEFTRADGTTQEVQLLIVRPQNSPPLLTENNNDVIACISGLDCILNSLNMPIYGQDERGVHSDLGERGLVQLLDLKVRPSRLVLAIPNHPSYSEVSNMRRFTEVYTNGHRIEKIGTEFPNITRNFLTYRGFNFEDGSIYQTFGKTEGCLKLLWPIIEIMETGTGLERYGGYPLTNVLNKSTPRLLARQNALSGQYKELLTDLYKRMRKARISMENDPEYADRFTLPPRKSFRFNYKPTERSGA